MTTTARDLAHHDPWARSLERSLSRRGRRSPVQAFLAERAGGDLADPLPWSASLARSRARRHAEAGSGPPVGRRSASLVALAAVTGTPVAGTVAGTGALGPAVATARPSSSLERGARGPRVVRLQLLLRIPADGVFGASTRRAVLSFQRRHDLRPDG